MAEEITRYIPPSIQCLLWGRAAGRCEFEGCNLPLWKSPVTQEQVNIAEKAHICSFSDEGPRGNTGISAESLNDISNLLLVCEPCHKTIDLHKDGGRYPANLLQQMKQAHEQRIELASGITQGHTSHVLHYGANIGEQGSLLQWKETAYCLFPERYPAVDRSIDLGTINSAFVDHDDLFWTIERHNLETKFRKCVQERLAVGEIEHLSAFALAPQPLLILLGTLLTDIPKVDVFQLHREPQGWQWPESKDTNPFQIQEPGETTGQPVLAISLSADITRDRIEAVLGSNLSIWTVTASSPNNDLIKTRNQLGEFRTSMRSLMNRIKVVHGQNTQLHIFPAAPVSTMVELGRIRMPKADMPWRIYDQINAKSGFIPALDIPEGSLK